MLRGSSGVPGSGKSLYLIDQIMHEAVYKDREVYAHAIEEWERAIPIRCSSMDCRSCRKLTDEQKAKMHLIDDWQSWAPLGCIVVVDEAHYPFPSRREQKAPQYIIRLTESRHDGTDWWFITPNINFLDITVRRLLEEHIHFVKGKLGRYRIRHTQVMENDADLTRGDKERFILPKRSFNFYKSADMHVKLKRPIPRYVYALAGLFFATVGAIYFAYAEVTDMKTALVPEVAVDIAAVESAAPGVSGSLQSSFVANDPEFGARLNVRPELIAGTVAACMSDEDECRCYDDQAYRVQVVQSSCRAVTEGIKGMHVNPRTLVLVNGSYRYER